MLHGVICSHNYVKQVAELNGIAITEYHQKRQRRLQSRFEGVVLESVGSTVSISTSEYKGIFSSFRQCPCRT